MGEWFVNSPTLTACIKTIALHCLIIRTERTISTFTYQICASKHLFMNSNHIDRLKMENIPYQFQKSTFLASGTNSGFRNLFHRTWKWNMAKMKITHLQYLPCKCSCSHSDHRYLHSKIYCNGDKTCQV